MDGEQPVDVYEELLAVKGRHLLHTAVLLAGGQQDGEDLLQAALERVFARWRTIRGKLRQLNGWPTTMAHRNQPGERHERRLRAAPAGRDGTGRRAPAA
jgi:DNA-directed RNA polymerase specialized sigma24 family protein